MIFRYWFEPSRLWYMPWKFKIFEWHAYEIEYWSKADRQMIAGSAHAKTGRYIKQLFKTRELAYEYMKENSLNIW